MYHTMHRTLLETTLHGVSRASCRLASQSYNTRAGQGYIGSATRVLRHDNEHQSLNIPSLPTHLSPFPTHLVCPSWTKRRTLPSCYPSPHQPQRHHGHPLIQPKTHGPTHSPTIRQLRTLSPRLSGHPQLTSQPPLPTHIPLLLLYRIVLLRRSRHMLRRWKKRVSGQICRAS